ncbi:MAG: ABC transporter substrate-binding protein [Promethearchaeota archaeon]
MESLTKRILAIVLIAVIGIGVGVTVWIFVAPYQWTATDAPGAPANITEDQIIRIGVSGDTERIQGEGQLNGARLAAYEINSAGGIVIGGKTYYIGITYENTDEANPILDPAKAVAAVERLINYKNVQFATGGFRTEALGAYRGLFMENEIIFINTGAAPSAFCASVLSDYDTYKYFFQINPINTTALAMELIALIIGSAAGMSQPLIYGGTGHNVTRFSFMREDLSWTADFKALMAYHLQNNDKFNLTYTDVDIAFPQDVTPVEMAAHWATVNASNTQIIIPIISGSAGLTFANSYGTYKPGCIPIGINVLAQDGDFWDDTNGLVEYGISLESIFQTNKTSLTLDFWDAYVAEFGVSPIYTSTGSYDAIMAYAHAFNASQSLNTDAVITALEGITTANPIEGASGWVAFDSSHCIVEGWPYGTALALQWFNGSKILVPGVGIYPSDPYGGLTADPSGKLVNMQPIEKPDWGLIFYD